MKPCLEREETCPPQCIYENELVSHPCYRSRDVNIWRCLQEKIFPREEAVQNG